MKKLNLLLWLLTLIPPLIVTATEMNKTILVGYVRIVDFVDLVVMAPFIFTITLGVHSAIYSQKPVSKDAWLSLVLIGFLLYGHAMHLTANSINTYSTEIKDYRNLIPEDSYALIYFLDEQLGHWLLYLGLFGAFSLWTWSCELSIHGWSSLLVCGFIFGISYGVVIIESSQVWLTPLLAILLIGSSAAAAKKRAQHFLSLVKHNPISQFTLMMAVGISIGTVVYFLITGGFVEPSKYGL